ncbi:MAG TPA: protease pro-enzyme activation domain-containing protein [Thermoplasmata archaeon]|nr:protease pro-enzyme activation domain-containing protein [Thermoplasmata archaeon]
MRSRWSTRLGSVGLALVSFTAPLVVLTLVESPAGAHPSPPTVSGTGALPAALRAPWALRAGYSAAFPAETLDPVAASGTVSVHLELMPKDVSMFLARSAPSSRLSLGEIADRYGATPSDYSALGRYFTTFGLSVGPSSPDRLSLSVSGTAPEMGRAFSTTLEAGTYDGRAVQFPESTPSLPAPLAAEVSSVTGLSSGFSRFTIPYAPAPAALPPETIPAVVPSRSSAFATPSAVRLGYDLNGLYNASGSARYPTGYGIALLLWGWGYDPSDLNTFFGTYYPSQFPVPNVTAIPVDGAPRPSANAVNDPSQAPLELTLDLEWAASTAPGASLYAVYAPDGQMQNNYSPTDVTMEDALSTAVRGNYTPAIDAISMSFGTPDGSDAAFQAAFTSLFAEAGSRGITLLSASGDNGGTSKASCGGTTDPQFPAASPYVIAVGGTAPIFAVDALGQVTGIQSEPAWNLSGGGYSVTYTAPSWQLVGSARAPIAADGFRGIPDVSGPAGRDFVYFGGASRAGMGTSFASPIWAGLVVSMDAAQGRAVGFVTDRLYAVGAAESNGTTANGIVDITSGANCLGPAGSGWDTATGWGSPRAATLYLDLVSTYVNVTLSVSPSSVLPGGQVTAMVAVANATSGGGIGGLPVQVSLAASAGYAGPCGGALATTTLTTNASGGGSTTLSVPSCYFGSHAQVTAVVESNGYFGQTTTSVNVNLDSLAGFLAALRVFPYNVIGFALIIGAAVGIAYWVGRRRPQARPGPAYPPRSANSAAPPARSPSSAPRPSPAASTVRAVPVSDRPSSIPAASASDWSRYRPPAPASAPSRTSTEEPMDVEPELGDRAPGPAVVPDHVLDPPAAPSPLEGGSAPNGCATCGHPIPSGATVCPGCGLPV